MEKNLINFKKIILFFFLGLMYVNTIAPNKYPDNQTLEKRFFEKNHEVEITPQKFVGVGAGIYAGSVATKVATGGLCCRHTPSTSSR